MVDIWNKEKRSYVMSRIRSKDTKPELIIRKILHNLGLRFRLHKKDMPGNPDLIFSRYNSVIFVHGCFWHQHKNCIDGRLPATRTEWWKNKFNKTKLRDKKNIKGLKKLGWRVLVIWECEIERKPDKTVKKVLSFLNKNIK